jgi:predicted HicB family RNase H-like nuclease
MRKTETLNLRVSPEFKRRLIEEASKEKRSVTNFLEVTFANLWKQKGLQKKGTKKVKEENSKS